MASGDRNPRNGVALSDAEMAAEIRAAAANPEDGGDHRAEVLGVARGGGLNLAGATFNQILKFAITFLLARFLGRAQAGLYFQAYAFLALVGILAAGGFKQSLTRFVAVHRADDDPASLRGTVRLGLLLSTGAATVLGALLFAASDWLAFSAFEDPRMAVLLRFVAVSLPATVYTDAALSATQGFKTMRPFAGINLVFEPAMRIVLTVGLLWAGWGVEGAMVALLLTNLASAALAAVALRRLMGRKTVAPRYNTREVLTFSAVSWGSQVATSALLWADTIILGILRSPGEVGVYQIASRLTVLATTFINPVGAAFAPRVADLYRRGRHVSLQRTYALITSWIFRLALPAFVVLLVFPRELLALFGPGFTQGAEVTVLLALGQMFNAASGPCGYMLIMSGRPALQMTSNMLVLAGNLGLNILLIPRYGITGAGAAWAASIALGNTARLIAVRRSLGMWPFDVGFVKGVVAGAAALAVAWAIAGSLEGSASLAVGSALIAAVYVVGLMMLRFGSEDRLVFETMRGRLRPGRV